jgi:hypothetical protein
MHRFNANNPIQAMIIITPMKKTMTMMTTTDHAIYFCML